MITEHDTDGHEPRSRARGIGDSRALGLAPQEPQKPTGPTLRMTVLDIETGDTDSCEVMAGDYLLITAEPCWLDSTQVYKSGQTHVLTVKGRTRG